MQATVGPVRRASKRINSTGTITFASIANLPAGVANQVVSSFSITMPTSGSLPLTAIVSSAGETVNTLPNTATLTTVQANIAPVARNVWNSLRSARGNTATMGEFANLAISPLKATDVDGSIVSYMVVSVPLASQGVLYFYNGSSYVAVADNTPVGDGTKLYFVPKSNYVGDATFTYLATDNGNGVPANALTSPAAIYTIPVAVDNASVYAQPTVTKGRNANKYVAGDVLACGIDTNTAQYNSAGLIYDTATGGAPATGTGTVSNGLLVAKISAADSTSLAAVGILFTRSTGLFTVSNPAKLPRADATFGPYTVTSIDLNGGINTNSISLVTGVFLLPVELTDFTAAAVKTSTRRCCGTRPPKRTTNISMWSAASTVRTS